MWDSCQRANPRAHADNMLSSGEDDQRLFQKEIWTNLKWLTIEGGNFKMSSHGRSLYVGLMSSDTAWQWVLSYVIRIYQHCRVGNARWPLVAARLPSCHHHVIFFSERDERDFGKTINMYCVLVIQLLGLQGTVLGEPIILLRRTGQ